MSRQFLVRVLHAVAIAAMLTTACPVAHAQNVTWTGTSSDLLWSNTLNWLNYSAGAFNSGTGNLSFTGSSGTSNNNLASGTYRSLNFLSTLSAPLTLTGNSLTLSPATAGDTTINNQYTGGTVTIQNDLVLSNNQVWRTTTGTGPNAVTIVSGNITGTGALVVTTANTTNPTGVFVLAGANSWTGAPSRSYDGTNFMNTGSGGLLVTSGYVRFQGNASLPTGAVSGTSYISAQMRTTGTLAGVSGILLTGSAAGSPVAVYDLSDNYRFLLGSHAGERGSAFGAVGGRARIQGSSMLLNSTGSSNTPTHPFEVGTGAELTLGASGSAFNLIPTFGVSGSGTPTAYANTSAARTINKTGPGTLVLENINYTTLDLTGTTTSQFNNWTLTEGAVRGLGSSGNSSNSLVGRLVSMRGGVYEIDAGGSSVTFTARIGGTPASSGTMMIDNSAVNTLNSGGFSAFNGNASVSWLDKNGSSSTPWTDILGNGLPLIFGSETANGVITFTNNLGLAGASGTTREIRVVDNTASTGDLAVMSGILSGASNLNKTGAGTLRLSASNTYTGTTSISAGVLEIASTGRINTSSRVTINGGELRYNASSGLSSPITFTQGTISGTGAIGTAITAGTNQFISPGNSPGIQPYTSGLTFAPGGTYQWEINALTGTVGTNWDSVNVTGALGLSTLSTSSKFNLNLITLTGSNTPGALDSPYSGGSYVFPIATYTSLTVPVGFTTGSNSDLTSLFNISLANWVGTKPNLADISVKVNATGTGLNLIVVPEPATIALAGIAAACAGIVAYRRRRPTA